MLGKGWRTKSPGTSTYIIPFYKETEAQRDELTFQCYLISKWQNQDLNLGVSDSKFKKYILYATLPLYYLLPSHSELTKC